MTLFTPELDWQNEPALGLGHTMMTDAARGSGAIFSTPEPEATHRYALWRVWDSTQRPLVVIGLNPSTATHEVDDPTIRRCIGFARRWGYGGLVMLNLFSVRSTNPEVLEWGHRHIHGRPEDWPESITGGPAHDRYLQFFTETVRAGVVLAAWGTHGTVAGRDRVVTTMLKREGRTIMALGLTTTFQPRHPLYIRGDVEPMVYQSIGMG